MTKEVMSGLVKTSIHTDSSANKDCFRLDTQGVGPRKNLSINLKFLNYSVTGI